MAFAEYNYPDLQLVFHSATDLAKPLFSPKAKTYVMAGVVSPMTMMKKPNWNTTRIDEQGGENPFWNYEIRIPLKWAQLNLPTNFQLVCKVMDSALPFGDREIGRVKIRLSRLLFGAAGENISYPVVSNGEEVGRILISHKLLGELPPPPPPMVVPDPNQNPQVSFLDREYFRDLSQVPVLELAFHHGIDLPRPSYTHKMKPYAMAALVGRDDKPNWIKTVTDEVAAENPEWEYVIQFALNQEKILMPRNFNLLFKIMHSGSKVGHRETGNFKVCLRDFLVGTATGERIHYPVMISDGTEKGKVVISHKVVPNTLGTAKDDPAPPPEQPNTGAAMEGVKLAATVVSIGVGIFNAIAS